MVIHFAGLFKQCQVCLSLFKQTPSGEGLRKDEANFSKGVFRSPFNIDDETISRKKRTIIHHRCLTGSSKCLSLRIVASGFSKNGIHQRPAILKKVMSQIQSSRSIHSEIFYKKLVLKKFLKTEKKAPATESLFLIKLQPQAFFMSILERVHMDTIDIDRLCYWDNTTSYIIQEQNMTR